MTTPPKAPITSGEALKIARDVLLAISVRTGDPLIERWADEALAAIAAIASQPKADVPGGEIPSWQQRKSRDGAAGRAVQHDMYYANCEIGDLRARLAIAQRASAVAAPVAAPLAPQEVEQARDAARRAEYGRIVASCSMSSSLINSALAHGEKKATDAAMAAQPVDGGKAGA